MSTIQRIVTWWSSRPCRICHGSGVDEGLAFGRWYSMPCSFCDQAAAGVAMGGEGQQSGAGK